MGWIYFSIGVAMMYLTLIGSFTKDPPDGDILGAIHLIVIAIISIGFILAASIIIGRG